MEGKVHAEAFGDVWFERPVEIEWSWVRYLGSCHLMVDHGLRRRVIINGG